MFRVVTICTILKQKNITQKELMFAHNPKVYRIRKSIVRTTMLKLNIYYKNKYLVYYKHN